MKRKSQFERTLAAKWAVVFAVLLFAVFATAEATHFHPSTAQESGCSLCLATHLAAAPTGVISATPVLALVFAPAELSEPQLQSRLFVPVASIRPPPAA